VIHLPAVVCTSSPSTPTSLESARHPGGRPIGRGRQGSSSYHRPGRVTRRRLDAVRRVPAEHSCRVALPEQPILIVGVIREVFAAPTLHYDRPHA
jgi:hypothetical protein